MAAIMAEMDLPARHLNRKEGVSVGTSHTQQYGDQER
jgi:hypothetical protein